MENVEVTDALRLRNVQLLMALDKLLALARILRGSLSRSEWHERTPEIEDAQRLLSDQTPERDIRLLLRHLIHVRKVVVEIQTLEMNKTELTISQKKLFALFEHLKEVVEDFDLPESQQQLVRTLEKEIEHDF